MRIRWSQFRVFDGRLCQPIESHFLGAILRDTTPLDSHAYCHQEALFGRLVWFFYFAGIRGGHVRLLLDTLNADLRRRTQRSDDNVWSLFLYQ